MALFGRPTERDEAKAAAYREWLVRRNPWAIASTVLGLFSLTHFGALWIDGIAAIVFGVIALRQLSDPVRVGAATEGRGLAWLGIVTAALSIGIAVFLYRWA
jgi:hypothetical protein